MTLQQGLPTRAATTTQPLRQSLWPELIRRRKIVRKRVAKTPGKASKEQGRKKDRMALKVYKPSQRTATRKMAAIKKKIASILKERLK